mmetsp:Transcript_5225/g.15400  ORF Transcript_5225/g.15400 Transcript_5225/m.15400 type:complete len:252 (+) Transcript_5225:523-1278(+)
MSTCAISVLMLGALPTGRHFQARLRPFWRCSTGRRSGASPCPQCLRVCATIQQLGLTRQSTLAQVRFPKRGSPPPRSRGCGFARRRPGASCGRRARSRCRPQRRRSLPTHTACSKAWRAWSRAAGWSCSGRCRRGAPSAGGTGTSRSSSVTKTGDVPRPPSRSHTSRAPRAGIACACHSATPGSGPAALEASQAAFGLLPQQSGEGGRHSSPWRSAAEEDLVDLARAAEPQGCLAQPPRAATCFQRLHGCG